MRPETLLADPSRRALPAPRCRSAPLPGVPPGLQQLAGHQAERIPGWRRWAWASAPAPAPAQMPEDRRRPRPRVVVGEACSGHTGSRLRSTSVLGFLKQAMVTSTDAVEGQVLSTPGPGRRVSSPGCRPQGSWGSSLRQPPAPGHSMGDGLGLGGTSQGPSQPCQARVPEGGAWELR